MKFEISLNNLKIFAYHGVLEEERRIGNEFFVSLTVLIPYSDGILNDNLEDTVSYADLFQIIDSEMKNPRNLLEAVAASIIAQIKERFSVIENGKITIEKVHPPIPGIIGSASVSLSF